MARTTDHLTVKAGLHCAGRLCVSIGLSHLRSLHTLHVLRLLLRRHVVVHEPDAAELQGFMTTVCSGVMVPALHRLAHGHSIRACQQSDKG